SDGSIGLDGESKFVFLDHLSGALALSESFACSRDSMLKAKAQKALDFILARQMKGSGWGFDSESKRANVLTTAWAIYALKAGKRAGLKVPDRTFEDAVAFVDSVTDSRGWTWFEKIGEEAPDWFNNKSEFVDYPEWTAMALFVRLSAGQSIRTPVFGRGLELLRQNRPGKDLTRASVNFQYFYFASYVLFKSRLATAEWAPFAAAIRPAQELSGCADGSWSFAGRWGALYGRVGSTSLASWTLNLYYRYSRGAGAGSFKQPVVRLHFPDTAYWNPEIQTNGDGHFSGSFKLPDTIGSFRLTSRGMTKDTDVGQVVKWIRVRKDFFVRLHCPKFLYQDDVCQIRADLFDYQGRSQKIVVRLVGKGFRCQSDSLFSLKSIGNGLPQSVYWTLQARSAKELNVIIKARCGPMSDAIALTIPVRIFGERKTLYSKNLLDKGGEFEMKVSKVAAPGSQSLRLVLRPESSVFFDIFETLDFLVQFPYGCVEQTMSRFLPAVEVGDSFKQLGLPIKSFVKRFDSVTQKGVKRLAGFQKANGSWGWFASDAPNPFMTAYVVYGLSRAQKAGVELDETMIKRGCAYLKLVVKEQTNNDLKSFIYFALQSAGQGDLKEAKTLLEVPLSSYAKALLTLTLIRSGDRPAAEKLLRRLEKDRIDSGALSHFSTPRWFYKWENVSIETTAFAMLAFLEVKPNHKIVPKLKDWLLSKRQGKRWKTTKDSAAAVFGLIKFLALKAKENGRSGRNVFRREMSVTLNGKAKRVVVIDLSNPMESQFECFFDAQDLKRGTNKIQVSGADASILCQSTLTYVKALREMKAKAAGLIVTSHWDKEARDLKVGDEVTVRVNLKTKRDYNYLMVNVPIPAGAVVDRKSAKGVFAEFEARHDQGIFFLTDLKAGSHELRFKFKCKFAGRYRVRGARGELMYSPDINGASRSVTARIDPK
ncbi:MAG: alpha-2-macroglobulin family protein, partial [Planctomycetota bacterium]|nr:alpha-2-macroglobulin family protein [Planctomycetota bacterium]